MENRLHCDNGEGVATRPLPYPLIHWRRAEFVGLMPRHVRRSEAPATERRPPLDLQVCFGETGDLPLPSDGRGSWGGLLLVFVMQLVPIAKPLTLTLSPRSGEGIHWRRAEFVGLMPRHVRRSDSAHVGSCNPRFS